MKNLLKPQEITIIDNEELERRLELAWEEISRRRQELIIYLQIAATYRLLPPETLAAVHSTIEQFHNQSMLAHVDIRYLAKVFALALLVLGFFTTAAAAQEGDTPNNPAETDYGRFRFISEDFREQRPLSITDIMSLDLYAEDSQGVTLQQYTQTLLFTGVLQFDTPELIMYYNTLARCETGIGSQMFILFDDHGGVKEVIPFNMGCLITESTTQNNREREIDLTANFSLFAALNGFQNESLGTAYLGFPDSLNAPLHIPVRGLDGLDIHRAGIHAPADLNNPDGTLVSIQEATFRLIEALSVDGLCNVIPPAPEAEWGVNSRIDFEFYLNMPNGSRQGYAVCVEPQGSGRIPRDVMSSFETLDPAAADVLQSMTSRNEEGVLFIDTDSGRMVLEAAGMRTTIMRMPIEGDFQAPQGASGAGTIGQEQPGQNYLIWFALAAIVGGVMVGIYNAGRRTINEVNAWRKAESFRSWLVETASTLKNLDNLHELSTTEMVEELKKAIAYSKEISERGAANMSQEQFTAILPEAQRRVVRALGVHLKVESPGSLVRETITAHMERFKPNSELPLPQYNQAVDAYNATLSDVKKAIPCNYISPLAYRKEIGASNFEQFSSKRRLTSVYSAEFEVAYYGELSLVDVIEQFENLTQPKSKKGKSGRSPFTASRKELTTVLNALFEDAGNLQTIRSATRSSKRTEVLNQDTLGGVLIGLEYRIDIDGEAYQLLAFRDLADESLMIQFGRKGTTTVVEAIETGQELETISDSEASVEADAQYLFDKLTGLLESGYSESERHAFAEEVNLASSDSRLKKRVIAKLGEWLKDNSEAILFDRTNNELSKLIRQRSKIIAARLYDYISFNNRDAATAQGWDAFTQEGKRQISAAAAIAELEVNYASAVKDWLTATPGGLFIRFQAVEAANAYGERRILASIDPGHLDD